MTAEHSKKPGKPKTKWAFPVDVQPLSPEAADAEVERFFADLEKAYKDVPQEEIERGAQKIQQYLNGQVGWADLLGLTPQMLLQLAEHGYNQFKFNRLQDAERVFKVLTVLDWNNSYYHSMMGTILQRQKRFGEAVAEYTQAIELNHEDIVSFAHRGEIYLMHGLLDEGAADLRKAVGLDAEGNNPFAQRARVLLAQLQHKGKKE